MATYLHFCTSNMILVNRDSKDMVGGDASSLGMYHVFGLLSEHVLSFSFPHLYILFISLYVVPPFL